MTDQAVVPPKPGYNLLASIVALCGDGKLLEAIRRLNVAFAADSPELSLHAPWLEAAQTVIVAVAAAPDPHPQLLLEMPALMRNLLKVSGHDSAVEDAFVVWLRAPRSYDPRLPCLSVHQHPAFIECLGNTLGWDKITFAQDEAAIRRFLGWVNSWDLARRLAAKSALELVERMFPHRNLWATVHFPVESPRPARRGKHPQRYAPKEQ